MRIAGRVLVDGDQARHAATLLVLAAHEVAGTLRRDQHDVEILARLDLLEVDVEAVREQQGGAALRSTSSTSLYRSFCARSGVSMATSVGALDRVGRLGDLRGRPCLRLLPAVAALAHADDDVVAAVLEVERMRAALAAVAQDGDPGSLQRLLVHVLLRIGTHRYSPGQSGFQRSKTQEPRLGLRPVRGSRFVQRVRAVSRPRTSRWEAGQEVAAAGPAAGRLPQEGEQCLETPSLSCRRAHWAPSVDSSTARGRLSTAVQKETRGERPPCDRRSDPCVIR